MNIQNLPCTVCAHTRDQKVWELQLEPEGKTNILNNIYVGQIENIASNIQAAFIRLGKDLNGYLPLGQAEQAIHTSGQKAATLRPGDEILVQVSREAMKGKLPALTTNLNFSGKYLVLTTGNRKIGFSNKLSKEERRILNQWLEEERLDPTREYGIIVRTNSREASKEDFFRENVWISGVSDTLILKSRIWIPSTGLHLLTRQGDAVEHFQRYLTQQMNLQSASS